MDNRSRLVREGAYGQSDFIPTPRQARLAEAHAAAQTRTEVLVDPRCRVGHTTALSVLSHCCLWFAVKSNLSLLWKCISTLGHIQQNLLHNTPPFIHPPSPCWFATVLQLRLMQQHPGDTVQCNTYISLCVGYCNNLLDLLIIADMSPSDSPVNKMAAYPIKS